MDQALEQITPREIATILSGYWDDIISAESLNIRGSILKCFKTSRIDSNRIFCTDYHLEYMPYVTEHFILCDWQILRIPGWDRKDFGGMISFELINILEKSKIIYELITDSLVGSCRFKLIDPYGTVLYRGNKSELEDSGEIYRKVLEHANMIAYQNRKKSALSCLKN